MSVLKWRIAIAAVGGVLGLALTGFAAPESGIRTMPDRVYVHEESKVLMRIPDGWTVPAPYRLRKATNSSILGLEKEDPRIAMTIIFSPLGNRPWDEVIRATPEENRGDEYATLVTVYGKEKLSKPTTMRVGPFTVYKILIDDGPDKGDAGALYLFETGKADNRWKVRIRAIYPSQNREEYMKQVENVISKFGIATE
jgi:hypothetical protein